VKLDKDLREFLELFLSANVEFLVVGAHALAFHGFPRFTGDLDLWIRPSNGNADLILHVLERFGFGALGITTQDLTTQDQMIQLGVAPNRIDLLTNLSGLEFGEAWDSAEVGLLDGVAVKFISKAHFLMNKRATGRARDLADIAAIEGE
jgi:hypothetical protein